MKNREKPNWLIIAWAGLRALLVDGYINIGLFEAIGDHFNRKGCNKQISRDFAMADLNAFGILNGTISLPSFRSEIPFSI